MQAAPKNCLILVPEFKSHVSSLESDQISLDCRSAIPPGIYFNAQNKFSNVSRIHSTTYLFEVTISAVIASPPSIFRQPCYYHQLASRISKRANSWSASERGRWAKPCCHLFMRSSIQKFQYMEKRVLHRIACHVGCGFWNFAFCELLVVIQLACDNICLYQLLVRICVMLKTYVIPAHRDEIWFVVTVTIFSSKTKVSTFCSPRQIFAHFLYFPINTTGCQKKE